MTDTAVELETVEPDQSAQLGQPVPVSDEQLVAMLVERARSEGLQLTGQGGLLQQLTKRVLEATTERLPDRLRRPTRPKQPLTTQQPRSAVKLTLLLEPVPSCRRDAVQQQGAAA